MLTGRRTGSSPPTPTLSSTWPVSRNSSEVAAMNDPLANFDQIDDDLQEDRQRRARAAFVAAPGRSPDEAARATRLAAHRGLPFGQLGRSSCRESVWSYV